MEVNGLAIREIDFNLHEVTKSICKIIYQNTFSTGFFIKLFKDEKEMLCLMTNGHIITKEMIELKILFRIYSYLIFCILIYILHVNSGL